MPEERFELVTVPSGARSLRSLDHGETFHPGIGPMEEARILHVSQHRLQERIKPGEPFVIWDVGLGAAANALAVIEALFPLNPHVRLRSFDRTLAPLRFALAHAEELKYPLPWKEEIDRLLTDGHVRIGNLTWRIDLGDFRDRVLETVERPQAILFDPYSPKANPGMWKRDIFTSLRAHADASCTLTTYSRSTTTRALLLLSHWFVGRGMATGEKTETTVAATRLEDLREPLQRDWLARVSRSTAAGLRDTGMTSAALARELAMCPQMLPG